MKKIIILAFAILIIFNNFIVTAATKKNFKDVPATFWAKQYIDAMSSSGYINGYPDNTFKPNNNMTRIEFLVILSRIVSDLHKDNVKLTASDLNKSFVFEDVKNINWALDSYKRMAIYLYLLNDRGETDSYGKTKLNYVFGEKLEPNKNITREQVVALLHSILDTTSISSTKSKLSDIKNSKFKSDIIALENIGIIDGYKDKTFKPEKQITRAEVLKLVNGAISRTTMIKFISYYGISDNQEIIVPKINYDTYLEPIDVVKKVLLLESKGDYTNAYVFYSNKAKILKGESSYKDYNELRISQKSSNFWTGIAENIEYKYKLIDNENAVVYFRERNLYVDRPERVRECKLFLEDGKWYLDFEFNTITPNEFINF